MHSKTIALIALSAGVAVAKPHDKRHHWHHHGTGRPHATGGWGGDYNSTVTIQTTSTIYSTVTVQPSSAGATGVNQVADASVSASDCPLTTTLTSTSTTYVTVTAGADDSAANSTAQAIVSTPVADATGGAFYGKGTGYNGGNGYQTPSATPSATTSSNGSTYSSTPGSGGSKRGISFNDASMVSAFGSSVSWCYNWGATESGNLPVEFVPMMWGTGNVNGFANSVGNAKNVLSFNEPDLGAQSNIDPQTAAKLHRQGMQSLVGKVRIGSPAVTNANSTSPLMGQQWLEEFFQACGSDCPVDFIACHWYAGADNIDYFKTYMDNMSAFAKSKGINSVWLTEFQPDSGSDSQKADFMSQAVSYLESNPTVERYAGFMASDGTMLSGGSLNALGKAYAG